MTTELGTDISWWQGVVNFVKMKLAGAMFVIIRAGSCNSVTGALYSDYCVATNGKGAEEAGLRKGFYWYYREFGIEHAKKQARFFWNSVKEWSIEEGLFCDVEVNDAKLNNVFAFMVELQEVSGLSNGKTGIYSRALLWNALSGDHSRFKQFLCWVARYTSKLHPWNDWPAGKMYPWDEPDYHQYSADGNGRGFEFGVQSKAIDINRKFIYTDQPEDPDPIERAQVTVTHEGPVDIVVVEGEYA